MRLTNRGTITVVAGLALMIGACGGMRQVGTTAPVPVRTLNGRDAALFAQLLRMADTRQADSGLIERALTTGSTPVRVEALLAVGQVHARSLVPRLRDVVESNDTDAAPTAAYALGLIADTGSAVVLGHVLAHSAARPAVAREAAWALGQLGASGRSELLAALTTTSPTAGGVLPAVLYATAALRPFPAAQVIPFLAPSEPIEVQRAAAYVLSRARSPVGVRALLAAGAISDADTRMYVARGLSRRSAGDSLMAQATAVLATLAKDTSAHVRVGAVQALASYGASSHDAVTAALADSDENVRIAAADVLDEVLAGQPRREWEHAYAQDTALAYRANVVGAAVRSGVILSAIDHDNADRWQRSADWRYRAAAAAAATGAPIERVRDLALPLTNDPDGRVRTAAYTVFVPFVDTILPPGDHPWRRQFMSYGLADSDFYVRATVLSALRRAATAEEVPGVLRSYALARGDSQNDARVAAVAVIAEAWRRDSAAFTEGLKDSIRALPQPTDPLEYASIDGASIFSMWHPVAPHGHDASWYRMVVDSVVVPTLAGKPIRVQIATVRGSMVIALAGVEAPLTAFNFVSLVRRGFYIGVTFHRVVPAFVAQDGDPRGDGNGGPPYTIRDELNPVRYVRGTVGMALSGPDTGGSQYFLTLMPQPHLDGHYTVFGQLVEGFDVLDHIVQGDGITGMTIQ